MQVGASYSDMDELGSPVGSVDFVQMPFKVSWAAEVRVETAARVHAERVARRFQLDRVQQRHTLLDRRFPVEAGFRSSLRMVVKRCKTTSFYRGSDLQRTKELNK